MPRVGISSPLCIVLASALAFAAGGCAASLPPIILFPGLTGSVLQARLSGADLPHWFCERYLDWFDVWPVPEPSKIVPGMIDCTMYILTLQRNTSATPQFADPKGVEIRPYDFGKIAGVANFGNVSYFGMFVDYLEKNYGYVPDVNVLGATYDWRYTGAECMHNGIFESWKQLVETTYRNNGNQKVHLLGHSMGAPVVHFFLARYCDQAWKDTYVARFWGLGGAYLGAPLATMALLSLQAMLAPKTPLPPSFVEFSNTMPASIWMLPRPNLYNDTEMVFTPSRAYRVSDLPSILDPATASIYVGYLQSGVFDKVEAPGVDVTCIHGYGLPTPGGFQYAQDGNFSWQMPTIIPVDGDDTVPESVLNWCYTWRGVGNHNIDVIPVFNASHVEMVRMPAVWELIAKGLVGQATRASIPSQASRRLQPVSSVNP